MVTQLNLTQKCYLYITHDAWYQLFVFLPGKDVIFFSSNSSLSVKAFNIYQWFCNNHQYYTNHSHHETKWYTVPFRCLARRSRAWLQENQVHWCSHKYRFYPELGFTRPKRDAYTPFTQPSPTSSDSTHISQTLSLQPLASSLKST